MSQAINLTQGAQLSAKQTYQKRAQDRLGTAFPAFSFLNASANFKNETVNKAIDYQVFTNAAVQQNKVANVEAVTKNKSQAIPLYLVEKLQAINKNSPGVVYQREPLNLEQVTTILTAKGVNLTDPTDIENAKTEAIVEQKAAKLESLPQYIIEAHQEALRSPPVFKAEQPPTPSIYGQYFAELRKRYPPKVQSQCPISIPRNLKAKTVEDVVHELALDKWNRIFTALDKKDAPQLQAVAAEVGVDLPLLSPSNMAGRLPVLSTSNLPSASAQETSATASPARGSAMINSLFKSVRVPEFRFKWQFWAEKGQQSAPASKSSAVGGAEEYASRPKPLGDQIISVKEFYQHFNNIPVGDLKLRDSIHLFHLGVKPLWEDPRNARGGAYYFRISKELAPDFWHEICLLAVGDVLQGAVETKRESFNDDICGISYSVRWNAVQIAIWNRDADNEAGKAKLLATILEKLSERLQPKKDSYWYKAHKEHKGFAA